MATATTVMEPNVKISATKLLINGQWVNSSSGKTFPTINPSTGEVITQVAEADAPDVDKAVSAARTAFDKGPWRNKLSASQRGNLLYKLAELIEKHADELAQLEALDNGKPYHVARAADLPLTIAALRADREGLRRARRVGRRAGRAGARIPRQHLPGSRTLRINRGRS